ncbi:MAG TPA: biotin/lipoyl-binding protein [Verrucomicrobiae bacterium]|nr:biotin/lipoyl-binding protein [Verrucomicrobiae bacterium]
MGSQLDSNPKTAPGDAGNNPASRAPAEGDPQRSKLVGRWLSVGIVVSAALLGLAVLHKTTHHPRTDDATVLANFIGIAPQVEGPLVQLPVHDNQFVKQGDLLFEIDDRPYRYALENALSEQATLEGQISDETRKIAALKSAVSVAEANIPNAQAEVVTAERGIGRAQADWEYASNDLRRQEALLPGRAVSADDVDKARSTEKATWEALRQSQSQLAAAEAQFNSIQAQREEASNAVTTLEPLINQRGARAAAVKKARYDLDNTKVYAPFNARVTNLLISEGAYAHIGQQLFILIDVRRWWAVANFREGQLQHIKPGMKADVHVMSKPDRHFPGIVESIGFGVTPDPDVIGSFDSGLPDVQRTLNWVHLASRYPVRVRVDDPEEDLFRISESAVVIIRGQ